MVNDLQAVSDRMAVDTVDEFEVDEAYRVLEQVSDESLQENGGGSALSSGDLPALQLRQDLFGVLADAGQRCTDARPATTHQQRQQHYIRRTTVFGLHRHEA